MSKLAALFAAAVIAVTTGSAAAPAVAAGGVLWTPEMPRIPIIPGRDPNQSRSTYECSGDLGHLRRVYAEQVDLIEDASIVPICENDGYGLMRSDGNAGTLRQHLADNDVVTEALTRSNYRVEDVVGVRMTGDDTAIIYVHTFFYR